MIFMKKSFIHTALIATGLTVILAVTAFSIAISFPRNGFLFLKLTTRSTGIKEKINKYEAFNKKHDKFIPVKLSLAHFYKILYEHTIGNPIQTEEAKDFFTKAVNKYNEILALTPTNQKAMAKLAGLYFLDKKFNESEKLYAELIKLSPNTAIYYSKMGSIYTFKNDTDNAEKFFNKAVTLGTTDGDAYLGLANILAKKGDFTKGLALCVSASERFHIAGKKTMETTSYYTKGLMYIGMKRYFDAINQFLIAVKIDPNFIPAYLEAAKVASNLGMYDKTIQFIMNSPLNPSSLDLYLSEDKKIPAEYTMPVYVLLGKSYMMKRDYIKAIDFMHRAKSLGIEYSQALLSTINDLAILQKNSEDAANRKKQSETNIDFIAPKETTVKKDFNETFEAKSFVTVQKEDFKPDITADWNYIAKKYPKGTIVSGTIVKVAETGILVEPEKNIQLFIPIEDITWAPKFFMTSEHYSTDEEIKTIVLESNPTSKILRLGVKQLTKDTWEDVKQQYKEGNKIKGKVSEIYEHGVIIDINDNIKGFIALSDISWTKNINHPAEVFSKNQTIDAVVLGADDEKRRLMLGTKQLEQDPWTIILKYYTPGRKVKGTVTGLLDAGATVELNGVPKTEGFIGISDISWTKNINHPAEALKRNQEIEVTILNIDDKNRRINLGIKQLTKSPWELIQKGTTKEGIITGISDIGVFLDLKDGLTGWIPSSDFALDTSNTSKGIEDLYHIGDKIKGKIIDVNSEEKRVKLTIKGLTA
ncbi:30S ribosomal protein S1 [Candidatus Omnitrophus magneticus]|uniref:30S ribosomal protein S1 n=1 Tax=Candidatus Omnitrophus magneticus TaxID=1609969 RepID=A0A0F0CMZ3_9BACT|nr:30S ribosomal protein S1 [Candidatus Omnitrophus magneticus]